MLRVVIDTHVFLKRSILHLLNNNDQILEKSDGIVITPKIYNEYVGRAHSHGYRVTDVDIALRNLRAIKKLVWKPKSAYERIKVSNKEIQHDAHLIKAARAAHAKYIITRNTRDLLDYEDKIRREFGIEVVTPEKFLECT